MTFGRLALLTAAATCFTLPMVRSAYAQDEESETAGEEEQEESGESEPDDESEAPEKQDQGEARESEPEEAPTGDADNREGPPPAPPARPWRRFWLGLSGTLDVVPLPSGSDLCKLSENATPTNTLGVYCTNPDGSDFPSRTDRTQNDLLVPGSSGELEGGLASGNLRVLLAADYAPLPTLLFGVRLGYTFNGYPGKAAGRGFPWIDPNLAAELRATYVFGREPLTQVGFAPMVFVSGGASEFAASVTRAVVLNRPGQLPVQQPVDIWMVRGPWFAAAGAGARYQFSARVAFHAALRTNIVFGDPSVLLTVGPDIGVSYGF
jgi:hypothetical protein